jgi:hypothetical protein
LQYTSGRAKPKILTTRAAKQSHLDKIVYSIDKAASSHPNINSDTINF